MSGRRGPGAGRPTKLYRRSARQVAVTLPQRHYDLAGHILAGAVEHAARDGAPILDAVRRAAADAGHRLGAERVPRHGSSASTLDEVTSVLAAHGYEPRVQGDAVVLANCPFHVLARDHTALVCGLNLHLITAMLDEIGHPEARPRLDPAPDRCCVTLIGETG